MSDTGTIMRKILIVCAGQTRTVVLPILMLHEGVVRHNCQRSTASAQLPGTCDRAVLPSDNA